MRHQDGSTIDAEIESNYFEFEGSEYDAAFVCNITRRRRTEKRIHKSEQLSGPPSNSQLSVWLTSAVTQKYGMRTTTSRCFSDTRRLDIHLSFLQLACCVNLLAVAQLSCVTRRNVRSDWPVRHSTENSENR
ncbi:MAG: hypothetical protein QM754_15635 [Tepidisphaeraceae bacterium]